MGNKSNHSKALSKPDHCATEFLIEMQGENPGFAVNFEGFYWDSEEKRYHLIELLKCEESQWKQNAMTPWKSHPKNYWDKNSSKFLGQWAIAQDMRIPARYTLINYAEAGSMHADKVLIMEVVDVTADGMVIGEKLSLERAECVAWFIELNRKAKRDLVAARGTNPPRTYK